MCDPCARMSSSPPWESFMTSGRTSGNKCSRVNKRSALVLNAFNDAHGAYSRMNGCTYWFSSYFPTFLTLHLKTSGLRTHVGMLCTEGKILPACFEDLASTGILCRQQWLSSFAGRFGSEKPAQRRRHYYPEADPDDWVFIPAGPQASSERLLCLLSFLCFDRPFPNQASVLSRNWPSSCCRCSICRNRCSCTDHQEGKDMYCNIVIGRWEDIDGNGKKLGLQVRLPLQGLCSNGEMFVLAQLPSFLPYRAKKESNRCKKSTNTAILYCIQLYLPQTSTSADPLQEEGWKVVWPGLGFPMILVIQYQWYWSSFGHTHFDSKQFPAILG